MIKEPSPGALGGRALDAALGLVARRLVKLEETKAPVEPAELGRRLGKWAYRIPENRYNRRSTACSEFPKAADSTS